MIDNFFTIVSNDTQDGHHNFILKIDKESKIFEGHFPSKPVVPGVCALYMIKSCVEKISGQDLSYDTIKESKFLLPLLPELNDTIKLDIICHNNEDDSYTVQCIVYSAEEKVLKLKAALVKA